MSVKPVLFIDNTFFGNVAGSGHAADPQLLKRVLDGVAQTYDIKVADVVFNEATWNQSYPKDRAIIEWMADNNIKPTPTPAGETVRQLRLNNQPIPPDMGELATMQALEKPEFTGRLIRIASDDRFFQPGQPGAAYQKSTYSTPRILHNLLTEGAMDIHDYRQIAQRLPTLHARDPALAWVPEEQLPNQTQTRPSPAAVPESTTTVTALAEPPVPGVASGKPNYDDIRPRMGTPSPKATAAMGALAIFGAVQRWGGQLKEDLQGNLEQKVAGITAMAGDAINATGAVITTAAESTAGWARSTAQKLGSASRIFGRVAVPVGVVTTTADIGAGIANHDEKRVARDGGEFAGSLAGAWAGFELGALIGIETGPGAIITGGVGAMVFAFGGGKLAEKYLSKPIKRLWAPREPEM